MATDSIQATIEGEVTGQVAVGHHIVQIGSVHGGVVNVVMPPNEQPQPQPHPRPTPVLLRPRPFPGLLDREEEIAAAAEIAPGSAVELHGDPGVGKTALLRHLAHREGDDGFPDGTVYLSARSQPLADLYQSLFDAFYEAESPFKASEAWLRHAFAERRALLLLDDLELSRDELETLRGLAPACGWLLAAGERRLWDEGRSLAVAGLPLDAALELVAGRLGRPLEAVERPAARQLCEALGGHPLRLLQVLAPVSEGPPDGRPSLQEVAARAVAAAEPGRAGADELAAQPEEKRRVLAVLAAVGGAPLFASNLQAITGDGAVATHLADLERSGLVEAIGEAPPSYRLRPHLLEAAARVLDLAPWVERAGERLVAWAEENRRQPRRVAEEAPALRQLVERQVAAGRWPAALRTARAIEGPLALAGRWEAWGEVLSQALRSGRESADRAAEAWARHQIGTRALCLEDADTARRELGEALHLRQELGDAAGIAITRHNLDLLTAPPPAERPREEKPQGAREEPSKGGLSTLAKGVLGGVAVAVLVAVGAALWLRPTPPPPPAPPHPGPSPARPEPTGPPGPAEPAGPEPSEPPEVPVAELGALRLGPTSIVGGEPAEGKVLLRAPAADRGVWVELSSAAPEVVRVPARVQVQPGQTGAAFDVETRPVEEPRPVRVTARLGGRSEVAQLELLPPTEPAAELGALRLGPASIVGGEPAEGKVLLRTPAGDRGVWVELSSAAPEVVRVPARVQVQPGQTGADFDVETRPVEQSRPVRVTARLGERSEVAQLELLPRPRPAAELEALRLDPTSVPAGGAAVAQVLLSAPAPPEGITVRLVSEPRGLVEHPSEVRIPPGRREARLRLRVGSLQESRRVVLVARLGDQQRKATLAIEAPQRPPDPAARRIELRIVSRRNRFAGQVRITGVVANLGGPFVSTRGRQEAVLLETPLGGQARVVARKPFTRLAPGEELSLDFERSWNSSSPSEGEFPPSYVLEVRYDRRLLADRDPRNDDANLRNNRLERPGAEINQLFQ